MNARPSIIAFVGAQKSGKSLVAEALRDQLGFTMVECSEVLRRMIRQDHDITAGDTIPRSLMNDFAVEHRRIDPGFITEQAFQDIKTMHDRDSEKSRFVVSGIRHPEEMFRLWMFAEHWGYDVHFIGVIAHADPEKDREIRFHRLQADPGQRGAGYEPTSYEAFAAHDELELHNPDPNGMQVDECIRVVREMAELGVGEIVVNGTDPMREPFVDSEEAREAARERFVNLVLHQAELVEGDRRGGPERG